MHTLCISMYNVHVYTCTCMAKHYKRTLLALDAKLGPFSMIVCTRKSFSLAFLKNGCFSNSVAVGLENQTCKCTLQTYSYVIYTGLVVEHFHYSMWNEKNAMQFENIDSYP